MLHPGGEGWPLVGRGRELRVIRDLVSADHATAVNGARSSRFRGVVLCGPAGVGKTRLLRDALAVCADDGHQTDLIVGSASASSIPYGAVSHLVPDVADLPFGRAGAAGNGVLLQRLAGTVLARSADGLVLGVDDAHLLDDATATLVQRLLRSSTVTVLLTARDDMLCPSGIAEVIDSDETRRLTISPLDRSSVAHLASTVLQGPIDVRLAVELWKASRGNPLVLHEVIRAALDQGRLQRCSGGWCMVGDDAARGVQPTYMSREMAAVTSGVPVAVASRVASLDDEERIAMEAVALGEPLEVDHVLSLTSLRVAERLEEMGLLMAVVDAGHPARREAFRLAHPLFGEALRQRMAVTRRRRLAGRLVELVAAHGARRRDDVLRQASWLLSAGIRDCPDPLLAAARRATALGEPAVGERFGRAAYDAGGDVAALLAVGESLQTQGRAEEAEEWLARAAASVGLATPGQADAAGPAVTDRQSDVRTTAHVAAVRAFNLQWGLGRVEAAHDVLATAEDMLPDGDARARLAAVRAASLVFLERFDEALALACRVMHSDEVSLPVRVLAECPAQVVWTVQCRYQRVVDSADRLEPVLDDVGDAVPLVRLMVHSIRLFALIGLGRVTEAVEGCRSQMVAAVDQGCLAHAGYWAFQLGRSFLAAGRVDEARASLEEATQLLEHGAVFGHDASAHAGLGQTMAMLGDLSRARVAVEAADQRSDGRNRAWRGAIDIARCWIEATEGRVEAARRRAADVAVHEAGTGNLEREVEALDLLARLGDPTRVAQRLVEIAARSQGPIVRAVAATAEAAGRGDASALMAAGNELRAVGLVLHAADAYARAAVLLHRQEQIRRCAESTRMANELYERCGPVRTPARRSLEDVDPVATLSDRERDVCRLAAEPGVSNMAIARQLGVAERTVANHLGRAYRKLGVSGRDELTAVLPAPPVA